MFKCPGCAFVHAIGVEKEIVTPGHANEEGAWIPESRQREVVSGKRPHWSWNGDAVKPTFSPSILVRTIRLEDVTETDFNEYENLVAMPGGIDVVLEHPKFMWRCHSFVKEGRIYFLDDCSHKLAGQTVDLPDWNI